jgi:hypothetical protein
MKLVMIAYRQAIDDEVWDILGNGVVECTKGEKVACQGDFDEPVHLLLAGKQVLPPSPVGHGRQRSLSPSPLASGVHLGTERWSKLNNVLMGVLDDALAAKVMDGARELQKQFGPEGVKAFLLPCEEGT